HAPLWGLGRVIALEHPELACSRIDLGDAGAEELQALRRELSAGSREDQVALRGAARYVARLARWKPPVVAPPAGSAELPTLPIRSEGSYLITGGLGGLGLELAGWLVAQGARHLALLGRGAPGPAAEKQLAELRAAGAHILTLQADVASSSQLARALAQIE